MANADKIRQALVKYGLDAMLLLNEKNIFYATGFMSSDGAAVVTREESFFFTDSRYIEAAEKQVEDFTVRMTGGGRNMNSLLHEVFDGYNIKKLGVEDSQISQARYSALKKEFRLDMFTASGIIMNLRASKSEQEVRLMRRAQELAEKVFDEILGLIRPGVAEREIAAEIVYRLLLGGAERTSFDPIVVTGANGSMPHGVPGDDKIKAGDFVTMDFGCVRGGYCSDMTRTVAVSSATDEMKKVYETVLQAQLAGIAAAKPGVQGKAIDAAGRAVIEKAGYGRYFGHSFGHGVGIDIHESPNASPSFEGLMPEGAVVSAEPGIYIPGRFGVRIEDVIHLTGDGAENLTKAPKNLIIL